MRPRPLARSRHYDEEIAAALDTLSSRVIALGEFIENKRRPRREGR